MYSLLRLFSLVVLAWMGYRFLAQVHAALAVIVMLVAVVNLLAAWVTRHEPKLFAALHAKPVVKPYLNVVCWCMGEQTGGRDPDRPSTADSELLLKTAQDFQVAGFRAKQIVRGHDDIIDRLLKRIHETLTLRSRRNAGSGQPLSSFLLIGPDGIGKQYLSRVISKLLYRSRGTLVFECDRVTVQRLIGSKATPGELLEALKRLPFQLIVLERIDRAAPDMLQMISTILTQGNCSAGGSEQTVSFANATVVMTAAKGWSLLQSLNVKLLSESAWHRRAVEVLSSETTIDAECLNALSDIVLCKSPEDVVKAEVVAMLMKKEAAAHGVSLSNIEPEILMSQIVQIPDDGGFSLVPERVKRLLRRPLLAATQAEQESLSLRVRWPERITAGGAS